MCISKKFEFALIAIVVQSFMAAGTAADESKTRATVSLTPAGINEEGFAAGAGVDVKHDSGAAVSVEGTGGEVGLRANLKAATPVVHLGDVRASGSVSGYSSAVAGFVPAWTPLKLDSQITVSKEDGQSEIGQSRAIGSSEVGIHGDGAHIDAWNGLVHVGSFRAEGGVAGGILNDSADGSVAVLGPKASIEAQYVLLSLNGHGVQADLSAGYIYNLLEDVDHVLTLGGGASYVYKPRNSDLKFRIGPQAVYNIADVRKHDQQENLSSGKSTFVGARAAMDF